jgi:hypothetical protein
MSHTVDRLGYAPIVDGPRPVSRKCKGCPNNLTESQHRVHGYCFICIGRLGLPERPTRRRDWRWNSVETQKQVALIESALAESDIGYLTRAEVVKILGVINQNTRTINRVLKCSQNLEEFTVGTPPRKRYRMRVGR